jgi:hypothetical protein
MIREIGSSIARFPQTMIFLLLIGSFGPTPFLQGQTPRPGQDQSWFFETGLKVGSPFPELSVFDAAGKPFSTRSLKGQYTVVISGRLT